MDNNFINGFTKTAGIITGTMGKITKVVKKLPNKIKPTAFPKATHHPATVNLARKFKGKEHLMDNMRKDIGDKKFAEIVKMKQSKDIANYKPKAPVKTTTPSGGYQGTTHDYGKYRKEFKAKAIASRRGKF